MKGHLIWLCLFFGLTNAPATFCTLHNELFHPYLDDWSYTWIVGYSYPLNDHVSYLRTVFKVLRKNHLYVKKEKCSFGQTEILFLGPWMGIRAIEEWQAPTKVSELRSFLGLVNYYRRFIVSYSKQLKNLLKKNVRTDHGTALIGRVSKSF